MWMQGVLIFTTPQAPKKIPWNFHWGIYFLHECSMRLSRLFYLFTTWFLKYDLDLIILHYITWWHGYYLIVYHCSMFMLSTNCWGNAIFIFSLSFFYELLWNLGWLKSLPLCTFSSRNCYYHTDTNENC